MKNGWAERLPTSPSEADWLAVAARLAARGRPLSRPNPAVGALIVKHGKVVGRGWTQAGGRPHAEAVALAQAGSQASGSTIYVTLEPCAHDSTRGPACSDLIVAARPAAVVVGVLDPDPRTAGSGIARLRAAGIEVRQIDCPTAQASLAGYLMQHTHGRPHITLKLAASRNGRIARPAGDPQWITGEAARAHVHARRAQCDAILVGGGTLRSDQPRLDVRLPGLAGRNPRRFVLTKGNVTGDVTAIASLIAISALDDIQYLYVEGGASTAASFLEAGLVDRIELYRAPFDIDYGRDVIIELGLADLAGMPDIWQHVDHRPLGSDTFDAYERKA